MTVNNDKGTPLQENDPTRAITWAGLKYGDDGKPTRIPSFAERSLQVFGTFGGASVVGEGSNDGAHWQTLTDQHGSELVFGTPQLRDVAEAVLYFRPRVQGGDETTELTAILLARR
jgi:hypothetical protein